MNRIMEDYKSMNEYKLLHSIQITLLLRLDAYLGGNAEFHLNLLMDPVL